MANNFSGVYRGIVKDTADSKGRCRIYVPGVYPSEYEKIPEYLPMAEPAVPLFGGNASVTDGNAQTGWAGWPVVGAHVWIFFERDDHMSPIYFAACQGGDGWISEHNQQWVLQTKNVSIKLDEDPGNENSTSKRNSYNDSCSVASTGDASTVVENIEMRALLTVTGNVDIVVNGNANIKVTGNTYAEYGGNLYDTIKGNYYRRINGDLHEDIAGQYYTTVGGAVTNDYGGIYDLNVTGKMTATLQDALLIDAQNKVTINSANIIEATAATGLTLTATTGAALMAASAGAATVQASTAALLTGTSAGLAGGANTMTMAAAGGTANCDITTTGDVTAGTISLKTHTHTFTTTTVSEHAHAGPTDAPS